MHTENTKAKYKVGDKVQLNKDCVIGFKDCVVGFYNVVHIPTKVNELKKGMIGTIVGVDTTSNKILYTVEFVKETENSKSNIRISLQDSDFEPAIKQEKTENESHIKTYSKDYMDCYEDTVNVLTALKNLSISEKKKIFGTADTLSIFAIQPKDILTIMDNYFLKKNLPKLHDEVILRGNLKGIVTYIHEDGTMDLLLENGKTTRNEDPRDIKKTGRSIHFDMASIFETENLELE